MVSQGLANDDETIFHRLLQEGGPPRIRQQVVGTKGRRRIFHPMFADRRGLEERWFSRKNMGDFQEVTLQIFTKRLINYAKYSLNIP